ncbi:hypothetical protein CJ469_06447 [Nocardia farcinica]|nr:hypothetical protein CJ469_06447 [Nocardia farcinica]
MLNEMSGGSRDSEAKEVAVNPTGRSGRERVTIVTPAG